MQAQRLPSPRVLALVCALAIGFPFFLADERTRAIAGNTAVLVAAVCGIALPIGTILAFVLVRTQMPLRRPIAVVCGLLLFVPLYLQAAAWEAGFGLQGAFSPAQGPVLIWGWRGAIWVHAVAAVPWVVLIVGGGLWFVEPELEESALLDGSPWQVLTTITARRAAAAMVVAAVWVSIATAGEMTVTNLFQVRTYAEELYTELAIGEEPTRAAAATLPATIAAGCLAGAAIAIAARLVPQRTGASLRAPWTLQLGRTRWPVLLATALVLLVLVGVPLVDLCYQAGIVVSAQSGIRVRGWSAAKCLSMIVQGPTRFREEFAWSFFLSATAALGALAVGIPIAWCARERRAAAALTLGALACALALPGPVVGMVLIWLLNRPGASWLNWLYDDTIFAPWAALTFRAWPLATLVLWQAFRTLPRETLETAALEGAGPLARLTRIALPLRWPAVAAAGLVAFAVALGDLSASYLVRPPGVDTLASRIFERLHFGAEDQVAGISLALVAIFGSIGGATIWLLGRRPPEE